MNISLIYLPNVLNEENLTEEIKKIKKKYQQYSDFIQTIVLIDKEKSIDFNNSIFTLSEFELKDIKHNHILFLNNNIDLPSELFETISNIKTTKEYDFFQITDKDKRRDCIFENYKEITSLKMINKNVLKKFPFLKLNNLNEKMVMKLYFNLFIKKMKFTILVCSKLGNFVNDFKDCEILFDIINSLDINEKNNFMHFFDKAIILKLFKIIDSNDFINNLSFESQKKILMLFYQIIKAINNEKIKKWGLKGYIPFIEMVREKLYTESIYYIRILRGKRYWYNTTKEIKKKIKNYPIEESNSWKITAPIRKFRLKVKNLKESVIKIFIVFISLFFKLYYLRKEVWLISERRDQAEDNGYYFFKYCRENYPKRKIFYLIDKESKQLEKVNKYGNIIYHSSFKHWIYMLVARKYISAWVFEETSYPEGKVNFKRAFKNFVNQKQQITLQHGVIIHNIAPYLCKDIYKQQLFISSAKAEKEIIENTLGYNDNEVVLTGLARFDNLHDLTIKKQILIMPTWRRSLFMLNQSEFLMSDYYYRYYNLVRNRDFLNLIERENIEVIFYIHNKMQKFISNFSFEHENIKFLNKEQITLSKAIKESALLVTDYSSVMADFLYMEKPTLLYQFDPYNNHHGPVKEIHYDDFGEVVDDEKILVKKIEKIVKQKFELSKKYSKKSNEFFAYKDNDNCKRIFNAILNLK
ncbi:hypothetical protein GCM10011391_37300 [Pullulanibacillus camelliae]|uniref:Uncharacterized protein n=1 Tax=Pullulanibacillus camelliae TaxID=1707096 RepID=A0A8J2YME5_9BACL|nr:CDP-glycerol glycerophosphotransferase family protein [Pullulanibacillus camelliae]GGE54845.1 hypothetical protein GCM10011391_37300 [Pullulanibacillus camelliae]